MCDKKLLKTLTIFQNTVEDGVNPPEITTDRNHITTFYDGDYERS